MKNLFSLLEANLTETCISLGKSCFPAELPGRACCPSTICTLSNATAITGDFFCACKQEYKSSPFGENCELIDTYVPGWLISLYIIIFVFTALGLPFLLVLCLKKLQFNRGVVGAEEHAVTSIGTIRRFSSNADNANQLRSAAAIAPNNRSQLHLYFLNAEASSVDPQQTIVDAFDFPPAYPGSPQEERPPSYEEVFKVYPC